MPIFNKQLLEREAVKYGFLRDTFEKVVRLKRILGFIDDTEFLKEHLLIY